MKNLKHVNNDNVGLAKYMIISLFMFTPTQCGQKDTASEKVNGRCYHHSHILPFVSYLRQTSNYTTMRNLRHETKINPLR